MYSVLVCGPRHKGKSTLRADDPIVLPMPFAAVQYAVPIDAHGAATYACMGGKQGFTNVNPYQQLPAK